MKLFLKASFILMVAFLAAACNKAPEGQEVTTGDAVEVTEDVTTSKSYSVNTTDSRIDWIGSKKVGQSQHNGYLLLSDGELFVENDQIKGGTFVIDMNSLTNLDEEGDSKGKLEGHLKDADFFDVANFPTAKFEITGVTAANSDVPDVTHNITGNLTMKDVTKSITIPANVMITDEMISATTPPFNINRVDWNVVYGSGTVAGVAQDRIINDEVNLVIKLKANH